MTDLARATLPLKTIDAASIAAYGTVLEIAEPDPARAAAGTNQFQVIDASTNGDGWRLAILIVRERVLREIQHHPNTKESFEPVSGLAAICLAPYEHPDRIEAFALDRPIVLKSHIWHGLVALTAQAVIKIAENYQVTGVNQPLPRPLALGLTPTA